MSGFNAVPLLAVRNDGITFEMWDDRVYTGSQGDSWKIPSGFRTDFASIPAAVSWAVPKLGAYSLAAIVHDLLCEGLNDWHRAWPIKTGSEINVTEDRRRYLTTVTGRIVHEPTASAVDTDAIFYKIARDYGTDPVTASLLWVGVRWGALVNPARREGWLRTAPKVIGLSLLFAPVLLPASVLAVGGRLALRLARRIFR